MPFKWSPSIFLSRASKPDADGKTDAASEPSITLEKSPSKQRKSRKNPFRPGGKLWRDPFPRIKPSLREAGEDNDAHEETGSGPDWDLLMRADSEHKGTLLEQIEKNHEGFELMGSDIIVAVMGVTGAGKSTFISKLSGEDIQIGHGQQSCTMNVGVYHFMLNGVRIWLVDTPGFDDTNRSDSVVLKDIAYWLAGAYTKKVQLAGIIYLHRITDVRMQGSALRNLRLFNELCGSNNLKSVILATTHWNHPEGKSVPESVGQARVKELKETREFWGGMIERGSRVEKHDGSKASATRIVSDLVSRHDHVTLDIQRQLVDEKRSLFDTDAGLALRRELIEDRKKSEAKLAELKLDMESALREKDKRWQEQIKQDRDNLEARIRQGIQETEELKINLKKIAQEKDAQLQEMERKFEIERAAWQAAMRRFEDYRAPDQLPRRFPFTQADIRTPSRPATPPLPRPEFSDTDRERQQLARAQEYERWQRRQLSALRKEYGAPFRV